MKWEVVIGLETHVELSTRSKLFCGCSTAFGAAPNTQCCPVCTGVPGALPTVNARAVEYAVMTAAALHCRIDSHLRFDRKNYFYPDLPKSFQISQLYHPLGREGYVALDSGKVIRIHEMHLEEDAGKLIHEGDVTYIDYNRCGVPLIEIVTEPDFTCAEEVLDYLNELKVILEYLGVSDCKMQEGSFRCDVNLSVRPAGSASLGVRTEMKNLNSFRAVNRAIAFESKRQIDVLESGGIIAQETRRWDEERNESVSLRGKESARDYRYFPEPNLPAVELPESYVEALAQRIPELAAQKRGRYRAEFGLSAYDAGILASKKTIAYFFEAGVGLGVKPKEMANWILGPVLRKLKELGLESEPIPMAPEALVKVISMVEDERINRNTAVKVFDAIFSDGTDPEEYVRRHALERVSDEAAILAAVETVLENNPKSVSDYRAGKEKAFEFLIGQTMRALGGKADPKTVHRLLKQRL